MEKCHNCGARIVGADRPHDWEAVCPQCGNLSWLAPGEIVTGTVAELANYGVYVEFGDGVRGAVHISEMCASQIEHPSQAAAVGDVVRAKVLRVDAADRRIGLSLKRA